MDILAMPKVTLEEYRLLLIFPAIPYLETRDAETRPQPGKLLVW